MNKIIIDGVEITSEKLEALGWTPPAKPEIPNGCPVLAWDDEDDNVKQHCVYEEFICERVYSHKTIGGVYWRHCEIDYTRKGCVIPWNGGECPVDDGLYVTVKFPHGGGFETRLSERFQWDHRGNENDITAYVVWPA